MNEKELLKKLKNLKIVKPAKEWKEKSRDILLNQIYQGEPAAPASSFYILSNAIKDFLPLGFLRKISQPVWAVVFILLFAVSGGAASLLAARGTKPGDSFYIAKVVSEKTRYTFTFGDKEKAKLAVEFATNRTKEITQILEEENGEKEKKVEKLSSNFKREISVAKKKLGKIGISLDKEEEVKVFGANLEKDNVGLQVAEQVAETASGDNPACLASQCEAGGSEVAEEKIKEPALATSTAVSTDGDIKIKDVFSEAEKLFDEKNYNATLDKLAEVNRAIDKEAAGEEANGENGSATTTGE